MFHFEPNLLELFDGNLLPSRQRAASELVFSDVSIVFAIVNFVVNNFCALMVVSLVMFRLVYKIFLLIVISKIIFYLSLC